MSAIDNIDFVLPTELLLRLFSFLPYRSVLLVAQVSKNWNSLAIQLLDTEYFRRERYHVEFDELLVYSLNRGLNWNKSFEERRVHQREPRFEVIIDNVDLALLPSMCDDDFPSFIGNVAVWGGKYYYECKFDKKVPDALAQMGWCTLFCSPATPVGSGVGDDEHSYAIDSSREVVWHDKIVTPFGRAYDSGDIIGCGIDLDEDKMDFFCNGQHIGTAFTNLSNQNSVPPFYPAFSIQLRNTSIEVRVLESDLLYLPPGYSTLVKPQDAHKFKIRLFKEKGSTGKINFNGPLNDVVPHIKRAIEDTQRQLNLLISQNLPDNELEGVAQSLALMFDINVDPRQTLNDKIDFVFDQVVKAIARWQYEVLYRWKREFMDKHLNSLTDNSTLLEKIPIHSDSDENILISLKILEMMMDQHPPQNSPIYQYMLHDVGDLFTLINNVFECLVESLRQNRKLCGRIDYVVMSGSLKLLEKKPETNEENLEVEAAVVAMCKIFQTVDVVDIKQDFPTIKEEFIKHLKILDKEIEKKRSGMMKNFSNEDLQADLKKANDDNIEDLPKLLVKYQQPLLELYFRPEDQTMAVVDLLTDELNHRKSLSNSRFTKWTIIGGIAIVGAIVCASIYVWKKK